MTETENKAPDLATTADFKIPNYMQLKWVRKPYAAADLPERNAGRKFTQTRDICVMVPYFVRRAVRMPQTDADFARLKAAEEKRERRRARKW